MEQCQIAQLTQLAQIHCMGPPGIWPPSWPSSSKRPIKTGFIEGGQGLTLAPFLAPFLALFLASVLTFFLAFFLPTFSMEPSHVLLF